jgi:hypothetical protein
MNCTTCNTPYPAHELHNGQCLRCVGKALDEIRAVITDPEAVWVNILRGTIARPKALDHYDELLSAAEKCESERCVWNESIGLGFYACGCRVFSCRESHILSWVCCPFCGRKIEVKR